MRDWLKHLLWWLRDFPWPGECLHAYSSVVGASEETCLFCGKTQVKPQEELLWDTEMLEKHPEWKDAEIDY